MKQFLRPRSKRGLHAPDRIDFRSTTRSQHPVSKLKSASRYSQIRPLFIAVVALVLLSVIATACSSDDSELLEFDPESSVIASIAFSSPAFDDGDSIPVEYTCDGEDQSPPLRWSDVPDGARALAIIVDDPDAPGSIFRHWSVYNVPSGTRSLKTAQPTTVALENSTRQGPNEFGRTGYGGPCPPEGEEHEYVFFIYALTEQLDIEDGAGPKQVSEAIRGKVIGIGSFSGMYARR